MDRVIQGIKFKVETEVDFYEHGKVKSGMLAEDTTIQEMKFKAGTIMGFYENGKVKDGTLVEDANNSEE